MSEKLRVASVGLGWWSDVLADAAVRSDHVEIAGCFTRSADKRAAFADKYKCTDYSSFEDILADDSIDAIINTTPNHVHLETTAQAAKAGKHVFLDKPVANTIAEAQAITKVCRDEGVVLAVGYQRRRESHFRWIQDKIKAGDFGIMVQAEANISRDREGQFEEGHWRYTAEGMPGGVMLQIGLHYIDVLMMLLGPITEVNGLASQLVLPGDNPDVGSYLMKHENGAISTLSTSYASAGENYVMNIYGKKASAFYTLHTGLRALTRGEDMSHPVEVEDNDTLAEQLDEFALCIRNGTDPEVGGESAAESLAVVKAGVKSVKEGRMVTVAEILASGE